MQPLKKIILALFFSGQVVWASPGWTFEDAYDDIMLYLHALINYRFDQRWYNRWEANLFAGNGFFLSVGSVTVDDLLIDGHLVINHDLGSGWRFQGDGRWLETRHLNTKTKDTFMGLEKFIGNNLGLFLNVNPFYDKEYTDIRTGIGIYNDTRQNYFRLALKIDDFVYDEKNESGAVTTRAPVGLEWHGRCRYGNWMIFSTGVLQTGFARVFPDRNKSPELTAFDQKVDCAEIKFYYVTADKWFIGTGINLYRFSESKTFTESLESYTYRNSITDYFIEINYDLLAYHRLRNLSHIVRQSADSRGYHAHDYERTDLMTGFFYRWQTGRHSIEGGYMFTVTNWSYKNLHGGKDEHDDGYLDKLKLGWYYTFPSDDVLTISISHQVRLGGFGGANLQYIMLF
jgi:hypothetical protein